MYIEDLLNLLFINLKVSSYDKPILNSFVAQTTAGSGLTEKQSQLAIKLIKRYSKNLGNFLGKNITTFLDNPKFRYPIRKPKTSKTVEVVDHKFWGKAIRLEIPFNQEIINAVRQNKVNLGFSNWDSEDKCWMFSLEEKNLKFLSNIIEAYNILPDDELKNYFNQVKVIVNSIEKYIPMVSMENNRPILKNVSSVVPKLQSEDIISALFEARLLGVFTWDEQVTLQLNQLTLDSILLNFLNNESHKFFQIDSENYSVQSLLEIIKYTQPILFVIPPGDELKKTKEIYHLLIGAGFSSQQMSVMFRLSNKDDMDFNIFVKNNYLNNEISNQTKFVFVNTKIPKPVLRSNIRFNNIIVLGKLPHQQWIREYTKNKPNLVFYCEPNRQMEINFGDLYNNHP